MSGRDMPAERVPPTVQPPDSQRFTHPMRTVPAQQRRPGGQRWTRLLRLRTWLLPRSDGSLRRLPRGDVQEPHW